MLKRPKPGPKLADYAPLTRAGDTSGSLALSPVEQASWCRSIESLYKRERPLMLGVARRMLHDSVEAEDAVQEIFGKLLRLRKHECDLTKAYLLAAVRNECLRLLHLRARLRSIDPIDFDEYLAPMDVSTPPIEDMGDLLAALAQLLPARQNAVIQLRALGAATGEIAHALGISEATVRSHLRYARAVLKRERKKERGARDGVGMRGVLGPTP